MDIRFHHKTHGETKHNPTILDFNREEVAGFENKTVSELSITQLLQVLVRRGEVQENITVRKECGILMKKLHGEPLRKNPRRFNNGRQFVPRQQFVPMNGHADQQNETSVDEGYRGRGTFGSRGRGDFNGRGADFNGRTDGGFRRGGYNPRFRRNFHEGGQPAQQQTQ